MVLDSKLNFEKHLRTIYAKVNETMGLLPELQKILLKHSLLKIYKALIRPHLDYGDVIFDQGYKEAFLQKVARFQYNAALAITGAIFVLLQLLQKGFSMN